MILMKWRFIDWVWRNERFLREKLDLMLRKLRLSRNLARIIEVFNLNNSSIIITSQKSTICESINYEEIYAIYFYLHQLFPYLTTPNHSISFDVSIYFLRISLQQSMSGGDHRNSLFFCSKGWLTFSVVGTFFVMFLRPFCTFTIFHFRSSQDEKKKFWCRLISCYASLTRLIWDWKFNLLISSRLL